MTRKKRTDTVDVEILDISTNNLLPEPDFEESKPKPKPKQKKPLVTLRVFLSVSGIRKEHTGAFLVHTKHENLESKHLTIDAWHEQYAAFLAKPVK